MPKIRMRKTEIARGICLVSAVLLLFGGVLALVAPGAARPYIAFVFGMIMAVVGVFSLLMYFLLRSSSFTSEWLFAEGIAVLVLCGQVGREDLLPYSMGVWLLFSGLVRLAGAGVLQAKKCGRWWLFAIPGFLMVLVSILYQYVFIQIENFGSLFEGLAFLLQGAGVLFLWWRWHELPGCEAESPLFEKKR